MKDQAVVGIIMGSDSDLRIMKEAADVLEQFGIAYELRIVSAHRTPEYMIEYAKTAKTKGLRVIIAGAGGAAHLPGMVASMTNLPVIGVPIRSSNSIDGWDSILSILQMPNGVPVATVALNAAKNAGLLACKILAVNDEILYSDLESYRWEMASNVMQKDEKISGRMSTRKPIM
ncbi:MAG: 5-(carboxyamino)imidazole ribonucleotide mutase [Saprospiraceae bacterium]|nr:5-(carboxyamino)imidazole ribonucleotide mutase [Saprospiraceae bacterium]